MYFGVEFCQQLIPSLEDMKIAIDTALSRQLSFSLVTPYVTDKGIESLIKLFEYLEKNKLKTEVIINDFGVLKLLNDEYSTLRPVYGRLMNKMSRMPRFAKNMPQRILPGQLESYRQCSLTLPHYKKFLSDMRVERIEFDVVPQGLEVDLKTALLSASFYYPWTYITTGRVCEIGSMRIPPSDKFRLDKSCGKQCQNYYVHLAKGICDYGDGCAQRDAFSEYIFQKGNTIFMLCEAPKSVLKNLFELGFNRVIYEPCSPI